MTSQSPSALPSQDQGRQILNVTVYLASLASEMSVIGPMLDPVRRITATLKPEDPIRASDQETLKRVCEQLKQYLTTQEKIRSFTPQQLQERITIFQQGPQQSPLSESLGSPRSILQIVAAITAALIIGVFALPLPLTVGARGLTASSIFFMMVHLAAAWFFVSALRSFAPKLRQAYWFIACGVVILGFTQIVQPVVQVLELQSTPYNTLFSVLPLIPSYLLMYEGARRFAHSIGRQSRLLEHPALALYLLAAILIGLVLPHASSAASEQLLATIFTLQIINITIVVAFTALLGRILGYLTKIYARPVRLLLVFAIGSFGIGVYMWVVNALTGGVPEQTMLIPLILAIVVNGFILLRAGYDFNRASEQ